MTELDNEDVLLLSAAIVCSTAVIQQRKKGKYRLEVYPILQKRETWRLNYAVQTRRRSPRIAKRNAGGNDA